MAAPDPSSSALHAFDVEMMSRALDLAREAAEIGEVPVGAVVVRKGLILAKAYNLRETLRDPTAHAERIALTLAGRALGDWRLDGCTLYVTLEPCVMCAGAIGLSRIDRLVYGTSDPKAGACRSLYRLLDDPRLNHRVRQTAGILEIECGMLLSEFFREKRSPRKNDPRRGA
jgi:tRNA(adenine34) deaminase